MDEQLEQQWCTASATASSCNADNLPSMTKTTDSCNKNHPKQGRIQNFGIVGGPVSCVSLPRPDVCLYSQGSRLKRCRVGGPRQQWQQQDCCLVFDNGTNIHGVRHHRSNVYTAVFGGRQFAILCNVIPPKGDSTSDDFNDKIMQAVPLQTESSSVARSYIQCSDWIWDAYWLPTTNGATGEEKQASPVTFHLLIGLAHNIVELWSISVSASSESNKTGHERLQATKLQKYVGSKRCLTYCLDFHATDSDNVSLSTWRIAVGSAMQDIRIWSPQTQDVVTNAHQPDGAPSTNDRRVVVPEEACLLGHRGVIHNVKWVPFSTTSATSTNILSTASCPRLVSASDDRSLRLWEQKQQPSGGIAEWHCVWEGWGHTARIWGLGSFLWAGFQSNSNSLSTTTARKNVVIVSTGEDSTTRLWCGQTGAELGIMRGHACQCIWSVDACEEMIVTGGNDGSVALYDAENVLTSATSTQSTVEKQRLSLTAHDQSTLLVPDDRPKPATETSLSGGSHAQCKQETSSAVEGDDSKLASAQQKKKKRKKQTAGQVIVGMNFYDPGQLLVATRGGSLFSVDTTKATTEASWTSRGSWDRPLSKEESNDKDVFVDPIGGCSLASRFDSTGLTLCLAIGTTKGEIVIQMMPEFGNYAPQIVQEPNTDDYETSLTFRFVLVAPKRYRSVQGVAWLPKQSDNLLLSFHINSVLWWSLPSRSFGEVPTAPLCAFEIGTQAIPISFAFDEHISKLFVGDTRGNLVMFHVDAGKKDNCYAGSFDKDTADEETCGIVTPSSVQARLHQKEHLTDIVLASTEDQGRHPSLSHKRILSVGNDGCINESILDLESGTLRRGTSVTASSQLTGILKLWYIPGSSEVNHHENLIVAGYYGNTFVVLNVTQGYELFRVDTGGRQRQLAFYASFLEQTTESPARETNGNADLLINMAVCAQKKSDGRYEVILYRRGQICQQSGCSRLWQQHQYTLSIGLHGETIYSASFFPYHTDKNGCTNLALLTGSEDCGSTISFVRGGSLVATKRLPPQESCVRAVCTSTKLQAGRCPNTLLAVGGGKLMLQFYFVSGTRDGSFGDIQVYFLGEGKTNKKASIDHRINSVRSELLESPDAESSDSQLKHENSQYLVAAGDSQGNCHIYKVTDGEAGGKKQSWTGLPLPPPIDESMRKPILSLELVKIRSRLLLLIGTTGGNIDMWDLPQRTDASEWDALLPKAHQQGVAAFPATNLGTYQAHQMGVNSISAVVVDQEDNSLQTKILVCSGGDDQAITICELQIHFEEGTTLRAIRVLKTSTMKEASSSAIKEVHMLDECNILSVGYSKRLALWKWASNELILLGTAPASVGDINCFALSKEPETTSKTEARKSFVAVCGAGVDVYSVVL